MAKVYTGRLYNLKQFLPGLRKQRSKAPKKKFVVSPSSEANRGHPFNGEALWLTDGTTMVFKLGDRRGRFVRTGERSLEWEEIPDAT